MNKDSFAYLVDKGVSELVDTQEQFVGSYDTITETVFEVWRKCPEWFYRQGPSVPSEYIW